MALAPWRDLGLEAVCVTSYQALSGAGRNGPGAIDMLGNVLPDIAAEVRAIADARSAESGEDG